MKITFKNQTFHVRKNAEEMFNLKDIEKGWKATGGKGKALKHWKESPQFKELDTLSEFRICSEKGAKGKSEESKGTWANKVAMLEYAGHCSPTFRFAMLQAFKALLEGNDDEARKVAGSVAIDLDVAEKVSKQWKEYITWAYENFAEVNKCYGGNLTRLVVKKATGVSTAKNVQGKVDSDYISKLVAQNDGGAILAVQATLKLISNAMRTKAFKTMMSTRKGKKEAYGALTELLDWEE